MNAAAVKARLKNVSKETGRNFQDLLVSYGLERTLYRLSISKYQDKFTLKGGNFLYALYDGDYPRATTDVDLKEAIDLIKEFMNPVVETIRNNENFNLCWDSEDRIWG